MIGPSCKNASMCSMMLDGPQPYQWQDPDKIIDVLITAPDLCVADLGAGTGFFTTFFSRAMPKRKVAALEPETALVKWLKKRKDEEDLDDVEVIAIGHDEPGLD